MTIIGPGVWAAYMASLSSALGAEWAASDWQGGPDDAQLARGVALLDEAATEITLLVDAGLQDADEVPLPVYRAKLEQLGRLGRLIPELDAIDTDGARSAFSIGAIDIAGYILPIIASEAPGSRGVIQ